MLKLLISRDMVGAIFNYAYGIYWQLNNSLEENNKIYQFVNVSHPKF